MEHSLRINTLNYFSSHKNKPHIYKTNPHSFRSFSTYINLNFISRSTNLFITNLSITNLRKGKSHSSVHFLLKQIRSSDTSRYLSNNTQPSLPLLHKPEGMAGYIDSTDQGITLTQNRGNLKSFPSSSLERDEGKITQQLNYHSVSEQKDNQTHSSGLSVPRLLSRDSITIFGRKVFKLTEGDWKDIWARKFKKYLGLGVYSPETQDKLLFAYLNAKKQNLNSKYAFNDYLSRSHLISYNFNNTIKQIDLNSLYKLLKSFFRQLNSLISYPALEISPDKIKIRLFYYVLPSLTKKMNHESLHRYIRSDEKLYKELILRKKFKNSLDKFKMKLFIAKWKEENFFINIPRPVSFYKGLPVVSISSDISLLSRAPVLEGNVTVTVEGEREKTNKGPGSPIPYRVGGAGGYLSSVSSVARGAEVNPASELAARLKKEDNSPKLSSKPNSLDLRNSDVFGTSLYPLNLNLKEISQRYAVLNRGFNLKKSRPEELENVARGGGFELTVEKDLLLNLPKETRNMSPGSFDSLDSLRGPYEEVGEGLSLVNDPNNSYKRLDLLNLEEERVSIELPLRALRALRVTVLKGREVPSIVSLNKDKFKYFIVILEKLFKRTVILELVRLKYPYHESNILAQVLALSSKMKNFREIMKQILFTVPITNPTNRVGKQTFSPLPSYLSGLKVTLAGRLLTQRIVPRFTVQSFQIGSLARGKIQFMDSSRITLKNKRGAFSFKVTTSHIFDK